MQFHAPAFFVDCYLLPPHFLPLFRLESALSTSQAFNISVRFSFFLSFLLHLRVFYFPTRSLGVPPLQIMKSVFPKTSHCLESSSKSVNVFIFYTLPVPRCHVLGCFFGEELSAAIVVNVILSRQSFDPDSLSAISCETRLSDLFISFFSSLHA